ncbi:MAG: hypothetical protein GY868_05540 [Deltaproteobacteria bacterium]|nr:hypothetical protein [Deltaproteobacteria bacterium]
MADLPAYTISRLDRSSFLQGIAVEGLDPAPVIIEVPRNGITSGALFRILIGDRRYLLEMSAQNGIRLYGKQQMHHQGVFDFIECILFTVDNFLIEIDQCGEDPFCYMFASVEMSIEISTCVFDLL